MDSFIFKGKSSKDFKIIINSLPTISKPPLRVEEIEIDGVDGARYEELGYGCYEKKIKITITEDNIDSLINWLKGEGDLILSNEPDKYYNAKIIEQIDFERLMKYEPTEIKFRVQPFKYQYQEEKVIAKTGSVEGTEIKISDVKAIQMQVDGRSIQNGEPTPETPVEIKSVGYENLADQNNIEQGTINHVVGSDYNAVKQENSTRIRTANLIILDSNDNYTISCKDGYEYGVQTFDDDGLLFNVQGFSNTWFSSSQTFSGIPYIAIVIRKGDGTGNITPSEIEKIELNLVKGTKQHSYIPYGKYGIEVKTVGKQLFNKNNITSGKILVRSTGSTSTNANYGISDYIPVKKGITYYQQGTNIYYSVYYDKYYNYVTYIDNISRAFTPSQDGYIRTSFLLTDIDKVQVEVGDTPTKVEEYKSNTSVILLNEPLRSLPNGVKDIAYIKNNKLYVDRYVGSVVLNGSEDWGLFFNTQGIFFFNPEIPSVAKDNTLNGLSNYFINTTRATIRNNLITVDNLFSIYAQELTIAYKTIATVEEFKSWLSNNNVQVDYELATPVIEEYGEFSIFNLVDGENNISNSEDANMIIDYIETLNVNNLGNHTSKPIFEIEGVGKVDFILNNSNVFSYNFDDDGKVIIDSEKEDAYLGLTLKNRNMNGDFPIFNPGENKFTWDGLIKNISVSKKSRWL